MPTVDGAPPFAHPSRSPWFSERRRKESYRRLILLCRVGILPYLSVAHCLLSGTMSGTVRQIFLHCRTVLRTSVYRVLSFFMYIFFTVRIFVFSSVFVVDADVCPTRDPLKKGKDEGHEDLRKDDSSIMKKLLKISGEFYWSLLRQGSRRPSH